jgi:hypothetical protein
MVFLTKSDPSLLCNFPPLFATLQHEADAVTIKILLSETTDFRQAKTDAILEMIVE